VSTDPSGDAELRRIMEDVTGRLDPDDKELNLQQVADGFASDLVDVVLNQDASVGMLAVAHDRLAQMYGKIRDDMLSVVHDELKNDPVFDEIKEVAARHGLLSSKLVDITRPVETSRLPLLVLEQGEFPNRKKVFPSKPARHEARENLGEYFGNLAELPTVKPEQQQALQRLAEHHRPGVTATVLTAKAL
jgi:hypothetical protein